MNLWFSSLKTLRVEGLEILDEEAMVFSARKLYRRGRRRRGRRRLIHRRFTISKNFGFDEYEKAEDMENVEKI